MKDFKILICEPKLPYKKKDGNMSKNAFNYYFQDVDTDSVFQVYEVSDVPRKVGTIVKLTTQQFNGSFKYKFID